MSAQKTLATKIAIVLGASAAAVSTAHAASVFFPQVVVSPSVTTIISVVNTSDTNYNANGTALGDYLHYRLYYKDAVPTDTYVPNYEECVEVNYFRKTSQYDIQTIDVGGVFGADTKGVLFNDPSFNNDWENQGGSYDIANPDDLGLQAVRGYITVDNASSDDAVLGEAFVFEYANGATWGYQAYSQGGDMVSAGEFDYRFAAAYPATPVAIMPFEEISTSFMVTPVAFNMAPAGFNDYDAYLALGFETNAGVLAMFDRDEGAVSGYTEEWVRCVGRVDAADLLTDGALSQVPDGGWSVLNVDGDAEDSSDTTFSTGAVVIKLEYGADTFNGEPIPGVFNNGFVLSPYLLGGN